MIDPELIFFLRRGAYGKVLASGEDQDYLPQWLNKAGYATECKHQDLVAACCRSSTFRHWKIVQWVELGELQSQSERMDTFGCLSTRHPCNAGQDLN